MVMHELLDTLRSDIVPQCEPMLTLYLDIDPGNEANARGAPFIRLKDELRRLELPRDWSQEFGERLRRGFGMSRGRTLVAFAGEDLDAHFHGFVLPVGLSELVEGDIVARWGRPFVQPLLQLTGSENRYGVVHLDQARFRYFEVFLGEIEELYDAFRPLDTSDWRESSEATVGVAPGIPARGGMGKDRFVRRKEVWTHRFYNEAEKLLERAMNRNGVGHLFLLGPARNVQDFVATLSPSLAETIVAQLPPPANPNASASELLDLVGPRIAGEKAAREQALVDRLAEGGERGIEATLEALQQGRLELVATVVQRDKTVYLCSESGFVSTTLAGFMRHCPDQQHRLELLQELLPGLAERHGARLIYLRGEAGARLERELGGLAGLKRW